MNEHDTMKRLLEAVEEKPKALKVDDSNVSYSNAPNEQTIDHKTMNNVGDDLHKKKNHQFRSKPGDNPMAMTTVKVKQAESRLTKEYAQFLKEEAKKDEE